MQDSWQAQASAAPKDPPSQQRPAHTGFIAADDEFRALSIMNLLQEIKILGNGELGRSRGHKARASPRSQSSAAQKQVRGASDNCTESSAEQIAALLGAATAAEPVGGCQHRNVEHWAWQAQQAEAAQQAQQAPVTTEEFGT